MAHRVQTRGRRQRGSTQTPVWGATWKGGWHMEGPLVSGPWLGVWGGNANALLRLKFYMRDSLAFIPCGTMFPQNHCFAGDVEAS